MSARGKLKGIRAELAIAALAALAALLCWASAAQATGVTSAPAQSLEIKAPAGETNAIVVTGAAGIWTITDSAGVQITGGSGCTANSPTQLTCSGTYEKVLVDADDLDDSVTLTADLSPVRGQSAVVGGAGNDTIDAGGTFGAKADLLLAGDTGNDTVTGGLGNDSLDLNEITLPVAPDPLEFAGDVKPADGDDRLSAGGGNDKIGALEGADTVDAGAGDDQVLTLALNTAVGRYRPADDRVLDTIACGAGLDTTDVSHGDRIKIDCEAIEQYIRCRKPKCQLAASISAGKQLLSQKAKRQKRKPARLAATPHVVLNPDRVLQAMGPGTTLGATFKMRQTGYRKGKKLGASRKNISFELVR